MLGDLRITMLVAVMGKPGWNCLPETVTPGRACLVVIQEGVVQQWRKPQAQRANKQYRAAGY